MARKKLPTTVAKITGVSAKNPQRYRQARYGNRSGNLGPAPAHLSAAEADVWRRFGMEMPWLTRSDRVITEIGTKLRTRLETEEVLGMRAINLLRLCLASMGATPADRAKVAAPSDDDDPISSEFLN